MPVFLCGAMGVGAAVVAVGLALIALSAVMLALDASGVGGAAASGHPWHVALEDGAVAFYLAQLVSVSFSHRSAELRFAALPGPALVAMATALSAMIAVRLISGSVRKRMLVTLMMAVAYAKLAGCRATRAPPQTTDQTVRCISGDLLGSNRCPQAPPGSSISCATSASRESRRWCPRRCCCANRFSRRPRRRSSYGAGRSSRTSSTARTTVCSWSSAPAASTIPRRR